MKFIVNFITTFRLLYTLLLLIIKVKFSKNVFLINIILLFLTDFFDGILARKFKVQTYYGAILDTIADKVLSIVLILLLIQIEKSFILILIPEIMIGVLNSINFLQGKETRSSILGKTKTWLVAISIIFGYMSFYRLIPFDISKILCVITSILQIITFIEYIIYLFRPNVKKREKIKISSINDLKYFLFDTEYYIKNSQI